MSGMGFDAEAIRVLATILRDTGLSEIEIANGDSRIRVARQVGPAASPVITSAVAPVAAAEPAAAPAAAVDDARHPGAVLSPMVGIAYLSPEPGAAPFVSVGQSVAVGQTLLLIEAMKTFNQIKASKSGTVSRILIAGGAPVEYGEPLLIVE